MYIFLDTETTGFSKKGALMQDGQARVCQLAAIKTDYSGNHFNEFVSLIRPDGWKIGPGAEEIHGFSDEMCEIHGIHAKGAMSLLVALIAQAELVVCHSVGFDKRMIEIEAAYAGIEIPEKEWYCTMLGSLDICKLPGNYGSYKWPKLVEALPIICDRELGDGAHDAMVDTKGCKDLFFELKKRGLVDHKQAA